jgi:hypothetical protein
VRAAALIASVAAVVVAGALLLARCGGAEEAAPAPPVTEAEETGLLVGLEDDAQVLADPETTLRTMSRLGVDLTRFQLRWDLITPTRPAEPARPDDPAYAWGAYDEAVIVAKRRNIRVLFSILGTPAWANGGQAFNYAPDSVEDLRDFALAAARRYSGTFRLPDGRLLPKVDLWAAWNEPNLPFFLRVAEREPGASPADATAQAYAEMCTTVWEAVHEVGRELGIRERVACGETSARRKSADSLGPVEFLQAIAEAGARFDVYAHHAHPPNPSVEPSEVPRGPGTVTLANIDTLLAELDRLYGSDMRLWITEYGYQTKPDTIGISFPTQAQSLEEAFAIADSHPRTDMLVWFLLKDEPDHNGEAFGVPGWQSGLVTAAGKRKPSFQAFERAAQRIHAGG